MEKASQKRVTLNLALEDQLSREKETTLKSGIGNFNKDANPKNGISKKAKLFLCVKYMMITCRKRT